jgi:hypothetical protein
MLWMLLALLAGTSLALLGALSLYGAVGSHVDGGAVYVTPQSPNDRATLRFDRPPREMVLSNIGGSGSVDVSLGADGQAAPVRQLAGVELENTGANYRSTTIDLEGLSPGRYSLKVSLHDGDGGQVRYVVLEGGGAWAQVASWLVGICAGGWLALAVLAALETLTVLGWKQPRAFGA